MSWLQLRLTLAPARLEAVEQHLLDIGALSITYDDASDTPILEPLPGEHPLWATLNLTALFSAELDTETLLAAFNTELQTEESASAQWSTLADEPWERAWMDHYRPMQFGPRFWVVPHHVDPPDPQATNLRLDPGLAFGTGDHQTTAMCLRWLAAQNWPQSRVLDFGCGSGILGISAALLGAESVDCVDIDPQAIEATLDNSEKNAMTHKVNPLLSQDYKTNAHEMVVANILLRPLIALKQLLIDSLVPGGTLAMTGLLERDAQTLIDAYANDAELRVVDNIEGWVLIAGTRK